MKKPVFGKDGVRIPGDIKEASDAIAGFELSCILGYRNDYVQVFLLLEGEAQVAGTGGAYTRMLHRACMGRLGVRGQIRRGGKLGSWGIHRVGLRTRGRPV